MSRRIIDMGDRIEIAKASMEFADKYMMKPAQLYHAMVACVAEDPEPEKEEETK